MRKDYIYLLAGCLLMVYPVTHWLLTTSEQPSTAAQKEGLSKIASSDNPKFNSENPPEFFALPQINTSLSHHAFPVIALADCKDAHDYMSKLRGEVISAFMGEKSLSPTVGYFGDPDWFVSEAGLIDKDERATIAEKFQNAYGMANYCKITGLPIAHTWARELKFIVHVIDPEKDEIYDMTEMLASGVAQGDLLSAAQMANIFSDITASIQETNKALYQELEKVKEKKIATPTLFDVNLKLPENPAPTEEQTMDIMSLAQQARDVSNFMAGLGDLEVNSTEKTLNLYIEALNEQALKFRPCFAWTCQKYEELKALGYKPAIDDYDKFHQSFDPSHIVETSITVEELAPDEAIVADEKLSPDIKTSSAESLPFDQVEEQVEQPSEPKLLDPNVLVEPIPTDGEGEVKEQPQPSSPMDNGNDGQEVLDPNLLVEAAVEGDGVPQTSEGEELEQKQTHSTHGAALDLGSMDEPPSIAN